MSEQEQEVIEEIKELRRVIHAGLTVIAAQLVGSNDDNAQPSKEYVSKAFLQMQDVLSRLRQGD
ncbi:hypothetical protein RBB77_08980 [Tunturibacter psychrotolerans]|uniref:Uncharacterized protein n=1 Tax=Tunturiibacter psychrotolerans TaxID=3069686 RepID=A0AAU7ZVM1_9BACT